MVKLGPQTRIQELIGACPEAASILASRGMLCVGCGGAKSETLARAAQNHGASLDDLISELKEAAKKKP